jgi:hypothetical protein
MQIPGMPGAEIVGQSPDGGYLVSVNGAPPVTVAPSGLPAGAVPGANASPQPPLPAPEYAHTADNGTLKELAGQAAQYVAQPLANGIGATQQVLAAQTSLPPGLGQVAGALVGANEAYKGGKAAWEAAKQGLSDTGVAINKARDVIGNGVRDGVHLARALGSTYAPNLIDKQPPQTSAQPGPAKLTSPEDFAKGQPATGGSGPPGAEGSASIKQAVSFLPAGGGGSANTGALAKSYDAQKQAVQQAALVGQQTAAAQASFEDEQSKQMAARQQRNQAMLEKAQDDTGRMINDLQSAMKAEANFDGGKVDQSRWWNSRTTGQKVAAGISAFFSGWGGGHQYVQDAIKQDVQLQQQAIEGKRSALAKNTANQMGLVQLAFQRTGDLRTSMTWAEGQYNALAAQQAKALAAHAQGPEEKAKAQQLVAQLETTKQEKLQEAALRWQQLSLQKQELGLKVVELGQKQQGGLSYKDLQDQTEGYGKDMQPLVRTTQALETLEKAAGQKDIPGTGMYDSRKPNALESDDDTRVRQAKEQAAAVVLNILSGSGVSADERERTMKSYGVAPNSTEKEFRAGIPALRAFFKNQIDAVNGKYDPRARALWAARAGQRPEASTLQQRQPR